MVERFRAIASGRFRSFPACESDYPLALGVPRTNAFRAMAKQDTGVSLLGSCQSPAQLKSTGPPVFV